MDSLKKNELSVSDLKRFIVAWNNKYPLDRRFRKKYNIAFNSEEHRRYNQIDVYLDLLEDSMVEKERESYLNYSKLKEEYQKDGVFLLSQEERMTEEEKDDLFEKLRKGIRKTIKDSSIE